MIANRQVFPIRLDRIVRPSHHNTHIVGVIVRAIKICIISNKHRHAHLDLIRVKQSRLSQMLGQAAILPKNSLQSLPQLNAVPFTRRCEEVKRIIAKVVVFADGEERSIEESLMLELLQIDDGVADASAADCFVGAGVDEDAEGDVFEGELGVCGVGNPGL